MIQLHQEMPVQVRQEDVCANSEVTQERQSKLTSNIEVQKNNNNTLKKWIK